MAFNYASRSRKQAELLLVPMIDIFTVLVTFLLMTAVFSRITVIQLDLPSAAAGKPSEPTFRLEVIVRKDGLELTNGRTPIATIPKINGEYDLKALAELAVSLKRENPSANSASVLLEADVPYDYLVQVMDAIRTTQLPTGADPTFGGSGEAMPPADARMSGEPRPTRVPLFPKIAVGDAP